MFMLPARLPRRSHTSQPEHDAEEDSDDEMPEMDSTSSDDTMPQQSSSSSSSEESVEDSNPSSSDGSEKQPDIHICIYRGALKRGNAKANPKPKKVQFTWQSLRAARRQERNPSLNVIQSPKWEKRGRKAKVPLHPDVTLKDTKKALNSAWEQFRFLVKEDIYEAIAKSSFWHDAPAPQFVFKQWRPEDSREYIIDTGASHHAIAKNELTSREKSTIRQTDKTLILETGNGEVAYDQECDIFVQSLKCPVTALVAPKGTPSVLSVGKLIEDKGIIFQWRKGGGPKIVLPCGTERECTESNQVPYLAVQSRTKKGIRLVPHLLGTATGAAESGATTSSTASSSASETGGVPKVSTTQVGAEKPLATADAEAPPPPDPHPEAKERSGKKKIPVKKKVSKSKTKPFGRTTPGNLHNPFTHFPKDPNCEVCQKAKAMKAYKSRKCGEVHPGGLPKPEEFGDLITADHFIMGQTGITKA